MRSEGSLRRRLETIAHNLWWTWQPQVQEIFHDLDARLWDEVHHNPVAFLAELDDAALRTRAQGLGLESRIHAAGRQLDEYLASKRTWGHLNAGRLAANPVAYFSAEFGLHESLPLYSGGLGVLAGDHLKSASDLGIPLVGVGILYAQGYFIQRLDGSGWQQEEFGVAPIERMPMERILGADGQQLTVTIPTGQTDIRAALWKAIIGRNELILLDTDLEGNAPEFRDVTHRLYWGDNESRIRQELVLGVGGLRALRAVGIDPGVLHLNEGHSSFVLLEAIREEMHDNGLGFDEACDRVGRRCVFTTHTPVPAGHDRFDAELMERYLGRMRESLGLDPTSFLAMGRVDPHNGGETFCMTVLALKIAQRANGVSALHGQVSRRMWKELHPNLPVAQVPIGHITNGVHASTWMSTAWRGVLERHLGQPFSECGENEDTWARLRRISPSEIWETRSLVKAKMVAFVRERVIAQRVRRGEPRTQAESHAAQLLDPNALTLGFARRFATYKRATLLMRDEERLARLLCNPDRPVQIVLAGKSHPRDEGGKHLIQHIVRLSEREPFKGRIVFVEDYDMEVGRQLVQGVDVWLNNPRRPEEASGTSGMKVVLNGGLNCSILDGWWAEAYDTRNGFAIAAPGPHSDHDIQDHRDSEALYRVLENEVSPLFFERDESGLPLGWIARVGWAFRSMAKRYESHRMVRDYATETYLPAIGAVTSAFPRG